ncbi:MAG: hypothetical protein HY815_24640 [Candidatus Riflebacteria bacterium]|nr:hypothetical protein [Candidatus Riflebacteria bacterium]
MAAPIARLELVVVDADLEALALRGVLECFGVQVTSHLVGQASDLVRILSGAEPLARYVVISCHGDDRGLILPELHESVDAVQPYRGALSPADLRSFLRLQGCVVVNTGCSLGTPEFVAAFLHAGCAAYCGCSGDPGGDEALVYTVNFFYHHLCRGASLEDAHARAGVHCDGDVPFHMSRAAS